LRPGADFPSQVQIATLLTAKPGISSKYRYDCRDKVGLARLRSPTLLLILMRTVGITTSAMPSMHIAAFGKLHFTARHDYDHNYHLKVMQVEHSGTQPT
jgi:hypothetical protein